MLASKHACEPHCLKVDRQAGSQVRPLPNIGVENVVALVAWVSQKGGVSKSTLARALAVEAGRGGLKVKIADLDPGQGSTTDWHQDRVAAQLEPHIAVELFPTPKAAITAASGLDLLVIDGPARADQATLEIARMADLGFIRR